MELKDLKTGMGVKLRNGEIHRIMLNTAYGDILVKYQNGVISKTVCGNISDLFTKDLLCSKDSDFDIIEVYSHINVEEYSLYNLCSPMIGKGISELVWRRFGLSDLKTGMIVKLRNKLIYMVMLDVPTTLGGILVARGKEIIPFVSKLGELFAGYGEDMVYSDYGGLNLKGFDIMEVYIHRDIRNLIFDVDFRYMDKIYWRKD